MTLFYGDHSVVLFLLLKPCIKCDLITPRTVPDDIDLFDNHDPVHKFDIDLTKEYKLWIAYIYSHFNVSISKCLQLLENDTQFNKMWKCMFHFQPSYRLMLQNKATETCPAPHTLNSFLSQNYNFKIDLKFIRPHKDIFGKITVDTEIRPNMFSFWVEKYFHSIRQSGLKNMEFIFVNFTFLVHVSLRVNFTFIHFELKNPEAVDVLNEICEGIMMSGLGVLFKCFRVSFSIVLSPPSGSYE